MQRNGDSSAQLLANARMLRQNMTDAERVLWYHLRARRLLGWKFRRQVPFMPYVLDFYCVELALVIEVDGSQHQLDQCYDECRTAYLASKGLRVLRFWNDEVLRNTEAVLERIRLEIETIPSPPAPLPAGEGSHCC